MAKISGKNGKVQISGGTDWAGVANWSLTIANSAPEYSTSDDAGHMTSESGVMSLTGNAELVLDVDDPIYDRVKPGDAATLLLYENDNRKWTVPCRIVDMNPSVQIESGEVVRIPISFKHRGAWTYPDGTVSV